MQAIIKGNIVELRVSTITLQPQESITFYPFYCPNCGNFHQQLGGEVSKIYPFYEPSNDVPVISKCKTCGMRYNFQTHDGYSSEKVKVILHPTDTTNYFFCTNNKDKIIEFSPDVAITAKDNKKHGFPFQTQCPAVDCKKTYWFAEMLF